MVRIEAAVSVDEGVLVLPKGLLPLCPLVRSVRRPGCLLLLRLLSSPPLPPLPSLTVLLLSLCHMLTPLPLPPPLPAQHPRLPPPAKVIMYVSGCAGWGGRE